MDVWNYMINSAAWSVGGLAIGYLLGRTEREVRDLKKDDDGGADD